MDNNQRRELKRTSVCGQTPQVRPPVFGDPMNGLTAEALGHRLGGLSAVAVREQERDGALFSFLDGGRPAGRLFPAFQAWDGIAGEPLRAVLKILHEAGARNGSTAYVFFAGVTDLLGGLTPVEAMLGQPLNTRPLDPIVAAWLASAPTERLDGVIAAAQAHAV